MLPSMAIYPESVMTLSSKGKKEARVLVERGEYARYAYFDPETGKPVSEGKETVLLRNAQGRMEKLFIVPISGGKRLVFLKKEVDKDAKVWDDRKKREEGLF
jgi:hypothetical protein